MGGGTSPGTRSPTIGTRTSASTSGTGTTRSSARVGGSTAPTSSTAAATRPWAPPGATWTWPRSAARRSGRTRPRTTRRRRPTGGGTTTTPTAHERGAPKGEVPFGAKRDAGFRAIPPDTTSLVSTRTEGLDPVGFDEPHHQILRQPQHHVLLDCRKRSVPLHAS